MPWKSKCTAGPSYAAGDTPVLATVLNNYGDDHRVWGDHVDGGGNYLANWSDRGGQVYSAKASGCIGDGGTDDTAALHAAINPAQAAVGGTAYLPTGTYKGAG